MVRKGYDVRLQLNVQLRTTWQLFFWATLSVLGLLGWLLCTVGIAVLRTECGGRCKRAAWWALVFETLVLAAFVACAYVRQLEKHSQVVIIFLIIATLQLKAEIERFLPPGPHIFFEDSRNWYSATSRKAGFGAAGFIMLSIVNYVLLLGLGSGWLPNVRAAQLQRVGKNWFGMELVEAKSDDEEGSLRDIENEENGAVAVSEQHPA